jgi:subtilase family serine protease
MYRETSKRLFALAGAAIMVLSVFVALSTFLGAAAAASPASPLGATSGAASANSAPSLGGPLQQVAPASTYNPSGISTLPPSLASYYSIQSDPSAFSASAQVTLQVGLKPSTSLSALDTAVSNPASSEYRNFLSLGGIASAAGVSPAVYGSIVSYFASHGLTVESHSDLLTIGLMGTPGQLASAFHTNVQAFSESYTNPNYYNPVFDKIVGAQEVAANGTTYAEPVWQSVPQVFYANTASLTLPAGIAPYIASVSGFGDQMLQPQLQALYQNFPGVANSLATEEFDTTGGAFTQVGGVVSPLWKTGKETPPDPPSLGISSGSVSNSCQANYTWTYFGYEQTQIFFPSTMPTLDGACTLFTGADTILSEPDYGQGITIAVVEVGAVDPAQLAAFSTLTFGSGHGPNGLTTSLLSRLTYIDLGASSLSQAVDQGISYGWYGETALDIEYAATMAPEAHIDLISVPTNFNTAFDEAYSFIMAHLIGSQTCNIPASDPLLGPVFVYGATSDPNGGSACAVSITSNSYGQGETDLLYTGSPMYITFQNQLLEEMSIAGVTSFFASGDSGGMGLVVEDFAPADADSTISVGGGQMTAEYNGVQFPITGKTTFLQSSSDYNHTSGKTTTLGAVAEVVPVSGLSTYTYWDYPSFGGAYSYAPNEAGIVGGGFGASIVSPQPWYEAGNDTYSNGARIDPLVSNQGSFNMSFYYQICEIVVVNSKYTHTICFGPWNFLYGGTSFASPITAGEWALLEEQMEQKFGPGADLMGDIGPLLFEARNAWLAGASGFTNPYVPMQNIGTDTPPYDIGVGDYAPANTFTWIHENVSDQVPDAVDHPWWFASLYNPAIPPGWTNPQTYGGASAWNNLQGLGAPNIDILDQLIVGSVSTSHALLNSPFYVEEVTPSGDVNVGTLSCGESQEFQIVTAVATGNAPYRVVAYSGTPDDGIAYGGGTTHVIIVNPATDPELTFTYTPLCPPPTDQGPTSLNNSAWYYGYFLTTQETSAPFGEPQSFTQFADQVQLAGTLNLCISDLYDVCQTAVAEETMFHTYDLSGDYNLQGQANAFVTLTEPDGQTTPVESATVVQTSVVTDLCPVNELQLTPQCDPTLDPATYAPGAVLGYYLTDGRGVADMWDNVYIAEANCLTPIFGLDSEGGYYYEGSQPIVPPVCVQTQVYTITAYVDGLVSNTVTVYVEPQAGSFYPQLTMNSAGDIVGFVQFNEMTNVQYVNISIGGWPGGYKNVSFLPACYEPGIVVPYESAPGTTYYLANAGNYCLTAGVPNTDFSAETAACQTNDLAAQYDWLAELCGSGVKEGVIEVDLTPSPSSGSPTAPVTVSMLAVGWNDLDQIAFDYTGVQYFYLPNDIQYGLYWQDPLVFLPTHLTASQTSATVNGLDTFTFSGSSFPGATGTLELVSAAGTSVLATGLSGTFALDTSKYSDGSYQVVYVETAPGAITSQKSVTIYADNTKLALSADIAALSSELSTDTATIASLTASLATAEASIAALNAQVASLQSGWAATNASLASLQSELTSAQASLAAATAEVASLQSQVTSLQGQLATETATATSLQAQIATLKAQNGVDQSTIASLQSSLAAANAQIAADATSLANAQSQLSADQTQITTLSGQVATLQSELNAKKNYIAPAWYDTTLGGGLIVLIGALCAVIGVFGTYAVMHRRRPTRSRSPEGSQPSAPAPPPAPNRTATVAPASAFAAPGVTARPPEDVIRRAQAARLELIRRGDFASAARLAESARMLGEMTGVEVAPEDHETMYR